MFKWVFLTVILVCVVAQTGTIPIHERATEEQIRSASCALKAMPKDAAQKLITATQAYLKTRDLIALMKAFQADEVPMYIAKCFKVFEVAVPKERSSNRDLAHFYDGCERALRLLLIIEISRANNHSSETIKKLKDQLYESILRFNREYY